MKTLFIDSSRESLSVALLSGDKLLLVSNVASHSRHSNFLINEIQNILNKSNFTVNDIDNIVVLNGPGSFTGIRVGVTVAKTICWSLSKKLYQLSNLEALKISAQDDVVICVIPDKPNNSYVGIYKENNSIEAYLSIDSEEFNIKNESITIVSMMESDFSNSLYQRLSIDNKVSKAIIDDYDYLEVVKYSISKGNINPHLAEPLYLKKIDVEQKSYGN